MRSAAFLLFLISVVELSAQSQTQSPCPVAPAALTSSSPNIFNERQEQYLGDAYAEIEETRLRFVKDPVAESYLEKIGQRLLAVLPPTGFHFRYRIVDTEEVNASSIAGGHIYVTRKLIAAAANEDELAGVLAHEIGHILIHQQATETTADFNSVLHVSSVGDRADVFDKLHRLRNSERPWSWHPSGEKEEEIADAVAVYALMKAGYGPESYANFWNRVAQTHGRSGSVLGGIFHTTRPAEQRLRAIRKNTAAIPAGCGATSHSASEDFLAWRQRVIADPTSAVQGNLGDKGTQLNPPLRSDLTRLQFSADGKYALAQDQSTIFALARSPLRFLFQIDAPDADPAWFSPDSTKIVFSTPSLRVEQWDVANAQLLAAYEVVSYQPCLRHLLSPDGNVMACILNTSNAQNRQLGLTLWNVESGEAILKKDNAFNLSQFNVNFGYGYTPGSNYSWWVEYKLHWPLVRWAFTSDSKRLMVNREPTTLVYDLEQHGFVSPGGAVAKLNRKPFALVGNDRIAIDNWDNPQKSGLYSFPDGKKLRDIAMGDQDLEGVTRGNYLMLSPMKDAALGLLDLSTGQVPFTLQNAVLDVDDKTLLMETGEGSVEVTSEGLVPGAKHAATVDLPVGQLGQLAAAAISSDGKFLALSNKSRCAIWNVQTGQRILYLRPFIGGYFDEADLFYADFPKYRGQEHAQIVIDPRQGKALKLPYSAADHTQQNGDLLVELKPLDFGQDTHQNADLEVRDLKTNRVLWTHHFPHQTPDIETMSRGDEMVFAWDVVFAGGGHDEVKAHPELIAEQNALKDQMHGYLVEVFDKHTGKYLRGVVADVRHHDYSQGETSLHASAFGDYALVQGEHNTTEVYRFSTGARLGEVFGEMIAQDPVSGVFCVSNRENELIVYDAASVQERKRFTFSAQVRLAEFLPNRKWLLVVTDDQKIHILGADELQAEVSPTQSAASVIR